VAKQAVAVIDYGMGNLHSVASALQQVGDAVTVNVSSDAGTILAADKVVFPGVGAIRDCMSEIRRLGIDQVVAEAATGKPLLAICIGMQALVDSSEENGGTPCLGLIPGEVCFFGETLQDDSGQRLKVPHMGWSQVHQTDAHPLWQGIPQDSRFYFVHSYYVRVQDRSLVAAQTDYGVCFDAALHRDNIFAAQFHPEKSSTAGLRLLQNFLEWDGQG
jgi:glutamine amidotransferase